jgi:hypothetical protein
MPILGIGLHILVALFFAIHAIRNGQQMYWLLILFSFPLLGSIVYFFAIYLPNSRLEYGARKTVAAVARSLNPERELREARAAFEFTPSAQNQMRLAKAQLEGGAAGEAAINYEACLKGTLASDPEIKYCAARAFFECGRFADAMTHLEELRKRDINFRTEQVSLLIARCLAGRGLQNEAKSAFEETVARYATIEVKVEYAIWAAGVGDVATAQRLKADIDQTTQRWNRNTRELNRDLIRRLAAANIG